MISVVCVYNNETILNDLLLKSLKNQTAEYELILLDNREGRFKSAASALNYGGERANGDYIMFIHQDMWLDTPTWIEDAEKWMRTLPDVGVAGVLGIVNIAGTKKVKMQYSINVIDEFFKNQGTVKKPEPAESLDECLLIIPRNVFKKLKFDEVIFDGWDGYAPDYCLAIKPLGLKSYIIPGSCSHCCLRGNYILWEFRDLLKYHRRLYHKYKKDYKIIHTLMGPVSWKTLQWRATQRLFAPYYEQAFIRISRLLKKELDDCETVLDLGCSYISPLSCCNFKSTFGVNRSYNILVTSKRHGALHHHIQGDVRQIDFKPKSFDAVIGLNVFEYLPKNEGEILIKKMETWAQKKIFIVVQRVSTIDQKLSTFWCQEDFHLRRYKVKTKNLVFVKGISGEKRVTFKWFFHILTILKSLKIIPVIVSRPVSSIIAVKHLFP